MNAETPGQAARPHPDGYGDTAACKHCRRPVARCAALPGHAGCRSGYGWIHTDPDQWGHNCEPRSDGPHALPGPPAAGPEADREHAEWLHWAEGESYDESFGFNLEDMGAAFKAGMRAERDPQQALPAAVAALRTIAWGSTPEGKPIDPSAVADKALTELRRLGYDEERLADAAPAPQPAPGKQARQLDAALRGLAQIREHVGDERRDWAGVETVVNDVIAELNEIADGRWLAGKRDGDSP